MGHMEKNRGKMRQGPPAKQRVPSPLAQHAGGRIGQRIGAMRTSEREERLAEIVDTRQLVVKTAALEETIDG